MEKIRVGVIGYGQRGRGVTKGLLLKHKDYSVVAACDLYEDRMRAAYDDINKVNGTEPFVTTDYKELLKREDVDLVYVATAWESHVSVAIDAMKAKKAVALEVGGAYSLEELFEMVRTQEETGVAFMFMENCCYDKHELTATCAARQGRFGEIVHCSGSYSHDLRDEITDGNIIRHYRLRNYINRNTENYPTHELGPIARLLNINRGNRMVSLVSVASKAAGLKQYLKDRPQLFEKDPSLVGKEFKQGDIVHTIITCAGGETILLKLDTTLPLVYSREFTVRGTKGYYHIDFTSKYHGVEEEKNEDGYKKIVINDETERYANCIPPSWRNITDEQIEQGHGGMDYILWCELADAIKNGKPMPIDVYDAASWMVISVLAERSIQNGGAPQAIPDFTNGKWILREPKDVIDFSYSK